MLSVNELLPPFEPTRKNLYHYTTQEGLLGIAKTRSLWTTSIIHLNDSAEYNYALALADLKLMSKLEKCEGKEREFYERILSSLGPMKHFTLYVGSFSELGDSLSQWRAYTHNGVGFSVGFKDTYLLSLATKQAYRLARCIYDEKEHQQIISKLVDSLQPSEDEENELKMFLGNLAMIAPVLKSVAFKDEKEWRVVSEISLMMTPGEVEFRAGKSMLIPYRNFKLEDDKGMLQMSELYMGPTPNKELSQASLLQLGISKKLANPLVVQVSQIPYRSW